MGKRYFQILRAQLFNSKRSFANMCSSNWNKISKIFLVKSVLKASFFGLRKLEFNPSLAGVPLLSLLKRLAGMMLEISENHS